jgi:hypothetical protein
VFALATGSDVSSSAFAGTLNFGLKAGRAGLTSSDGVSTSGDTSVLASTTGSDTSSASFEAGLNLGLKAGRAGLTSSDGVSTSGDTSASFYNWLSYLIGWL